MQPTADLDAAMAAITEVLHNIAVSVAEANAAKLSPILHTAIPMLMKVPELYREVEGKLSKSRINLLLHALQAIIMMIQADTEENSLSQVVDDDEEMHSEFLQALVDLIPVVCDLELQLIAVRTACSTSQLSKWLLYESLATCRACRWRPQPMFVPVMHLQKKPS